MDKIQAFLDHQPLLREFAARFSTGRSCHLVGGAVRDALLGRPAYDFDFATPDDPTPLAQAWAEFCGGHWFWLDAPRRQSRVVVPRSAKPLMFDFAPYRGEDLTADLRGRDFTINAMALDFSAGWTRAATLIDPHAGQRDLNRRMLRACSPQAFRDDPLRVLRAARFAATLDLTLAADSGNLARAAAPELVRIAGERIKAELFLLVSCGGLVRGLEILVDCGVFPVLVAAALPGPALAAAIVRAKSVQQGLEHVPVPFKPLLETEVEAGLTRAGLLHLAAFLGGNPAFASALDLTALGGRLAWSRAVVQRLGPLLQLDAKLCSEISTLPTSERGRALWAENLGKNAPDSLLLLFGLCGFDDEARGKWASTLAAWQRVAVDGRIVPLVDGNWIGREIGVKRGRVIGRMLEALGREEIAGRVQSLEDARNFLKNYAQKEIDKG